MKMTKDISSIESISLVGNIAISSHTSKDLLSRIIIKREEALQLYRIIDHILKQILGRHRPSCQMNKLSNAPTDESRKSYEKL